MLIKIDKYKLKEILEKRIENISPSNIPHFSLLSDIEKATNIIVDAIKTNKSIAIVADYDVDGTTSAALMKRFFNYINKNINIIIPNRVTDGYGFTENILKKINEDIIITVDNAITSFKATEMAKKLNKKVIITDHHIPVKENNKYKLPKADAIVNPKISPDFPFQEICGAAVTWYLIASLKNKLNLKLDLKEYLDLVAIATISDIMPLNNINRTFVLIGLNQLNQAKFPYSKILKNRFKYIKSEDIAFQIGPRINAAGRLSSAYIAYNFLTANSFNEAEKFFIQLESLNQERKKLEKSVLEKIEFNNENFIIISGEFHEGIIGIIASKLVHKYKKPSIVFTKKGDILKGSGRSLGNIDLFSLINDYKEILEGFGGHKMACGLTIKEENLTTFKTKLNESMKKYKEEDFFIPDFIVGELDFQNIDLELINIIEQFEPYGEQNPKPKFITKATIKEIKNIKDNHYKLTLQQGNIEFKGIIFNYDNKLVKEEVINFKFSLNKYLNNINLIIEDIINDKNR